MSLCREHNWWDPIRNSRCPRCAGPDLPSEAERVLARIVDAYDARSELFTSDEICAGALADIARHYLASKP